MEIYTDSVGNTYTWIPDDGNLMEEYYRNFDNSKSNPFAMERRTSFAVDTFNALVGLLFRKDD